MVHPIVRPSTQTDGAEIATEHAHACERASTMDHDAGTDSHVQGIGEFDMHTVPVRDPRVVTQICRPQSMDCNGRQINAQ